MEEKSKNDGANFINNLPVSNKNYLQDDKVVTNDSLGIKRRTFFKKKLNLFFGKISKTRPEVDSLHNNQNRVQSDQHSSEEGDKNKITTEVPKDQPCIQEGLRDKHSNIVNSSLIINTSQVQDKNSIIKNGPRLKKRTIFKKKLKSFLTKTRDTNRY